MRKQKGALSLYCRYVKRLLDIFFSTVLIFFLFPLMFIIAVSIISESKGGAIFKQERMGRNGKIFVCLKFRTMYSDTPHCIPAKELREPEKYVTRVPDRSSEADSHS